MTKHSNPVIARPRVVIADPGKTPAEVKVDLSGTLEFRNHFPDFPDFEIKFDEPGPPSANDKLTGTITDPIFVHMPDADRSFRYHIVYKKKDGTSKHQDGPFIAHSCPGCSG
jgi:hypothetical protein